MSIETALLIEVPEADSAVARWRKFLDPGSLLGIPPHITILYPFIDRLDPRILDAIGELVASIPSFSFILQSVGIWPGVVYLAPTPDSPFRELTERVVVQWPEAQPYRGQFDDIIPHLTVAHSSNPQLVGAITADLQSHLPISAKAGSVSLMVTDGTSWTAHTNFPLGK